MFVVCVMRDRLVFLLPSLAAYSVYMATTLFHLFNMCDSNDALAVRVTFQGVPDSAIVNVCLCVGFFRAYGFVSTENRSISV